MDLELVKDIGFYFFSVGIPAYVGARFAYFSENEKNNFKLLDYSDFGDFLKFNYWDGTIGFNSDKGLVKKLK